jgi:hypothetical protein
MNVPVIKTAQILTRNVKAISVKKSLALEMMSVARIANVRKANTSSAMIKNNASKSVVEVETDVSPMLIAR